MSAQVRPEAVLSRTSEAVGQAEARTTPSALGRMLGRAHTTISRDWQDDLSRWPAADLLRFACSDLALRQEMIAALSGAPEILPMVSSASVARDLVCRFAREIDALVKRVADGHFDAREAALTERELDELSAQIAQLRGLIRAERKHA